VPTDRLEQSGLNRAWIDAAAALPLEWRIQGVACASTGLDGSERWRAWATGPKGKMIEGEGVNPIAALYALARELRPLRGSATG
jgi:hypothetical protein